MSCGFDKLSHRVRQAQPPGPTSSATGPDKQLNDRFLIDSPPVTEHVEVTGGKGRWNMGFYTSDKYGESK